MPASPTEGSSPTKRTSVTERTSLTLAKLASLKDVSHVRPDCVPPKKCNCTIWLRDQACPDLMVRGRPGRAPLFVVEYRLAGKRTRMSLGEAAPNLAALQTARDAAMLARKQARDGLDPLHMRRLAHHSVAMARTDTFQALHDAYIAQKRKDGLRWLPEMERTFKVDVLPTLGDRPMVDITADDAERLLRSIKERGAERQALVVYELLQRLMRWAVEDRRLKVNPFEGVKAPGKHVKRSRKLKAAELGLVWQATGPVPRGMFATVRLLLLTALRRDEIGSATWDEVVDLDGADPMLCIPAERMKGGRPHRVPLSPAAVEILKRLPSRGSGGFLFPARSRKSKNPASGWSAGKRLLDQEIARLCQEAGREPPEPFVLHDFRRSIGHWAGEAGFPPHVTSLVLAHARPSGVSEVDAIYMEFEMLPQRRVLLEAWAEHILRAAEGETTISNVIPLRVAQG
jgi:integrase